ncbi:MAG TPA: M20 family metallo-hydrolase [Bacteroidia bacterium]|jgi:acetylornithine deacetylase|nr:M20 family metallo-hydrolase [Bacteroidia bacterium]
MVLNLLNKKPKTEALHEEAISLLKDLIRIPSFSKEENMTASVIEHFLSSKGIVTHRSRNNVWAFNRHYKPALPTILLNSHHDTVKPNPAYTRDPFAPDETVGKLFGLGSNDAGGALVSLIAAFLYFHDSADLSFNLVIAATAEEEISGTQGLELILPELGPLNFAIVGEPTGMHLAIAEKGLLVLDCLALGVAGHAAREEGINAIYEAVEDMQWFRSYRFSKKSAWLGPVKMSVTMVKAGSQHNVVPAECLFTVDVRLNEMYTHDEILETVKQHVKSKVTPRSVRLRPSFIAADHPIVRAGLKLGRKTYGSPTTSDQALFPGPSLKIGPGDSARSHAADEFIYIKEIQEGIDIYIKMLDQVLHS